MWDYWAGNRCAPHARLTQVSSGFDKDRPRTWTGRHMHTLQSTAASGPASSPSCRAAAFAPSPSSATPSAARRWVWLLRDGSCCCGCDSASGWLIAAPCASPLGSAPCPGLTSASGPGGATTSLASCSAALSSCCPCSCSAGSYVDTRTKSVTEFGDPCECANQRRVFISECNRSPTKIRGVTTAVWGHTWPPSTPAGSTAPTVPPTAAASPAAACAAGASAGAAASVPPVFAPRRSAAAAAAATAAARLSRRSSRRSGVGMMRRVARVGTVPSVVALSSDGCRAARNEDETAQRQHDRRLNTGTVLATRGCRASCFLCSAPHASTISALRATRVTDVDEVGLLTQRHPACTRILRFQNASVDRNRVKGRGWPGESRLD